MNEYACGCGVVIMKETIMGMLDALAAHMMECPEGAKEAPRVEPPIKRPYPSRALYRGIKPLRVIGYAGEGYFICVWGRETTTIHRRHLTFTRQ